ncbi:MAG TPA: ADOP family duplicated permease [Thermoanaerobaculia bacterium]|nr:ADOP family duplicated permease [Thermoanaerobaculia bacterium]
MSQPSTPTAWTRAALHEVRTAIRFGRRSRASSLVAILTLALAIGASTAIYSTLEHVVLHPLPFEQSDRLVILWRKAEQMGGSLMVNPSRELLDHWRENARSFAQIEGIAIEQLTVDEATGAETWTALRSSPDYLRLLGRDLERGRMFAAAERDQRPALISYARWRRDYGGSDEVLGQPLRLDGELHTVVGVLPAHFPTPIGSPDPVDVLLPVVDLEASLQGIGRLAPGVTVEQARDELDHLLAQIELDDDFTWKAAVLQPTELLGTLPETLWTLMASVLVVLLVACTNVGGLLLGRHARRRRELALRSALGASRRRLGVQLFLESAWLSLVAGALGFALAAGGVEVIRRLRPEGMEALERARVSPEALAFALAASFAAAALAGLVPALRSARRLDAGDLRAGLGATADRAQNRLRAALVIGQVALSFLLTVAGILLVQHVRNLRALDLGFEAERMAIAQVRLPQHSFAAEEARRTYWREALAAVSRIPGVSSASLAGGVPPRSSISVGRFAVDGVELTPEQTPNFLWWNQVDSAYLRTAGIRVLAGRIDPASYDAGKGAEPVCLINESFARQIWGRADVVGERLRLGEGEWSTVVAVVDDVRVSGPGSSLEAPQLYSPHPGNREQAFLALRASGDPATLVEPLRRTLLDLDPRALIDTVATVDSMMWRSLAEERFTLALLGAFTLCALFLAVVGLYSVVAQGVEQRRKELALRLALGAPAAAVRRRIAAGGAILAGLGIALGLALTVALSRFNQSEVFGAETPGPRLYLLASLVIALAVAAATIRPARIAGAIDPIRVLREE